MSKKKGNYGWLVVAIFPKTREAMKTFSAKAANCNFVLRQNLPQDKVCVATKEKERANKERAEKERTVAEDAKEKERAEKERADKECAAAEDAKEMERADEEHADEEHADEEHADEEHADEEHGQSVELLMLEWNPEWHAAEDSSALAQVEQLLTDEALAKDLELGRMGKGRHMKKATDRTATKSSFLSFVDDERQKHPSLQQDVNPVVSAKKTTVVLEIAGEAFQTSASLAEKFALCSAAGTVQKDKTNGDFILWFQLGSMVTKLSVKNPIDLVVVLAIWRQHADRGQPWRSCYSCDAPKRIW